MTNLILAAGLLCLLYFIFLIVMRVDFGFIWLPAGVMLLLVYGHLRMGLLRPLPSWLLAAAGVCAAVVLAVFLIVEGLILHAMLQKPEKNLDYVIVLGAQVKGTVPSRALRRRLEAAKEYLQENPQTIAVLSGGQGDGEEITEAQCMYEYLTAHGIAAKRLLLEDKSTTTEENLRYSADIIDRRQEKTIGLLSNNFHIYRASLLARKLGYTNVSTIAARSDWRLQVHYLVREFFALVKEKLTGNI